MKIDTECALKHPYCKSLEEFLRFTLYFVSSYFSVVIVNNVQCIKGEDLAVLVMEGKLQLNGEYIEVALEE